MTEHEGLCRDLVETKVEVATIKEKINIIPEIKEGLDKLNDKLQSQTGFIAGVSATVSAIITGVGVFLQIKGIGK
jgi:hypothetical protein